MASIETWENMASGDYIGTMPNPIHRIKILNSKYGFELPSDRRLHTRPNRVGGRKSVKVSRKR